MINPIKETTEQLNLIISSAIKKAIEQKLLPVQEIPTFNVEIPSDKKNGDFSSNVAMVSAKVFKLAPRNIAQIIKDNLSLENTYFDKCEIAGPGFMNFFISNVWFSDVLTDISNKKDSYGRLDYGKNKKVMVEFVSANPTGPMHIGNARGGAIGDCLASVLDWAGYDVTREFYINDAGNQIEKFAISLEKRYLQLYLGEENVEFPQDAYQGEDIKVHAKNFADKFGDEFVNCDEKKRKDALVSYALPLNINNLKNDLKKYRIDYDVWFNESNLYADKLVEKVVGMLTDNGFTYEKDGAIWYKATQFGAEKDDVLIRANGFATYFAADIAYHYNKFVVRGFDKVINIWGADHHGHVARLKGAMQALGIDPQRLDIVLMQLVKLIRNGETVKVSKRTGKSITLIDLLEEIPIDAARFFFNLREASSHLDFDLDLAVEQSSQNPVYYVQYAHARICSIINNLKKDGITLKSADECELKLLNSSDEIELIRYLSSLPNEIAESAKNYDPARITRYAVELATYFHKFYNNCRVKCDDENLSAARLVLCDCVKTVLKNVLTMLKIDAPSAM
ncbi:MAG: arginine--tRNA ligase [Oscillospiraceae bacterium]